MIPLNPNFALKVSCAAEDSNPRHLQSTLLSKGWLGFYDESIAPQVLASDCGMVMIHCPGGVEVGNPLLQFDMMSKCYADGFTRHVGDKAELAFVFGQLKAIGRRTALYLGAVSPMDSWSAEEIEQAAYDELKDYADVLDEVYIDSANESDEWGAYPIVCRCAHHIGIKCGPENRALTGRYSHRMNHQHCVIGTKWDSSGGKSGDANHAAITGEMLPPWVMSDNADPGAHQARRYMRESGRVMVGWTSGIKASDIVGTVVDV